MLCLAKKTKNHTKNKNFATYANKNFMKSLVKIKTNVRSLSLHREISGWGLLLSV